MTNTIQAALKNATDALVGQSHSARADTEVLLAHVLNLPRGELLARAQDPLAGGDAEQFHALITRRLQGEPVAYLTGQQGFWSLDLQVNNAVLIPRAETELLVERAMTLPASGCQQVLDIGTGSGAIALALKHERPHWCITATDISAAALTLARANAARLQLDVRFIEGAFYHPLAGQQFDLIISNPPYIAVADPHLTQGDLRHEPRAALAAGADGLDALREIIRAAPAHLTANGRIMLEHGYNQAAAVRDLLHTAGFQRISTYTDLNHHERVTEAYLEPISK